MPKDENYIHISGWMVNNLKLKGNNLLVYALIYGFSQDGESEFKGTLSYITDWLNCSRMTAIRSLATLTENGLLKKKEIEIAKNLKLAHYTAIVPPVSNCDLGQYQNDTGGGIKMLPNNTTTNTTSNTNSIARPTLEQVRQYCLERGKGVDPEKWYDYYEANGWHVGKYTMKDWKAAVRIWERNGYGNGTKDKQKTQNRFNNFEQRNYDYAALEQQLLAAQRGGTS